MSWEHARTWTKEKRRAESKNGIYVSDFLCTAKTPTVSPLERVSCLKCARHGVLSLSHVHRARNERDDSRRTTSDA